MFAGHIGAAFAIGSAERRINVGTFIAAALFLDMLLWLFVLLGWESAIVSADFGKTHQAHFDFPYSHGLLTSVVWSALAGAAAIVCYPRLNERRMWGAALVGAAVFSHWVLDALVHVPELPLLGAASSKVGFGLWNDMPLALAAETLVVIAGIGLFVPGSGLTRARKFELTAICLVMLAFTVAGMTVAPPPPSETAMAGSSLATIVAVCAIAWWLGKPANEDRSR